MADLVEKSWYNMIEENEKLLIIPHETCKRNLHVSGRPLSSIPVYIWWPRKGNILFVGDTMVGQCSINALHHSITADVCML